METKEKKSVKGTKTEHNLMAAFPGESQARNRSTLIMQEWLKKKAMNK